jgi:hypothetical protein
MLAELWHDRSFPHASVKHAPSREDTSSYSLFGTHVVGSNPAVLTVKNLPHRLSYGSLLQAGNAETGRGKRQIFTKYVLGLVYVPRHENILNSPDIPGVTLGLYLSYAAASLTRLARSPPLQCQSQKSRLSAPGESACSNKPVRNSRLVSVLSFHLSSVAKS